MSELPPSATNDHQLGLRTLLLYACVGPAAAVAVLGAASVVMVLAGVSAVAMHISLVVAAAITLLVLIAAVFAADDVARQIRQRAAPRPSGPDVHRLADLESLIAWGQNDLQGLVERVRAGDRPAARVIEQASGENGDPFARVATALQGAQHAAWNAVLDVAGPADMADQRVEVLVNLARRMQSLTHRAIRGLDQLENQVEDPDLLKGLFAVDHLNTRMRRQAESLAVIGGASSRRQWSKPVTLYGVLRSAAAEVEQYRRVRLVPPIEGNLDGTVAADVVHLLAELVENATKFAPPQTQVLVRAEKVTAGVAIEIEDRGLGIPREDQHRFNDMLAGPDRAEMNELLSEGRIGLMVVAALSRRHGIAVRLHTNVFGGTEAVAVLPHALVGGETTITAVPTQQADVTPVVETTATDGERPPLPVRPVQRSLAPDLRTTIQPSGPEEPDVEHTPGLMAAFQSGVRGGLEADDAPSSTDSAS